MKSKVKVEIADGDLLLRREDGRIKNALYRDRDIVVIGIGYGYSNKFKVGTSICAQWQISDLAKPMSHTMTVQLFDQAFIGWVENPAEAEQLKKGSVFAFLNPEVIMSGVSKSSSTSSSSSTS